jgi:hypothetical protein
MANFFYYDVNGIKQGPVNPQQLKALAERGIITPGTAMEADTGKKGVAGQIPGLFATPKTETEGVYGMAPVPVSPKVATPPPAYRAVQQSTPVPVAEGKKNSWLIPTFGCLILLVVGFIGLVIIGIMSPEQGEGGRPAGQQDKATITVSAADLMEEFKENEVAANSTYKGKTIIVEGVIAKIGESGGKPYIELVTEFRGVGCELSRKDADSVSSLRKGQSVTIKGTCTGKAVLFAVWLNNCSIVQPTAGQADRPTQTVVQSTMARHDFVKDSKASVPLSETFRNTAPKFSFRYPKDWKKSPNEIKIVGPADSGGSPSMNIQVVTRDDDFFKMTQTDWQKIWENAFQNVRFKDFGIRRFAGKECVYQNIQITTEEGLNLELLQFSFHHGSNTLVISCGGGQRNFEKIRPVFDSIISSFQFD